MTCFLDPPGRKRPKSTSKSISAWWMHLAFGFTSSPSSRMQFPPNTWTRLKRCGWTGISAALRQKYQFRETWTLGIWWTTLWNSSMGETRHTNAPGEKPVIPMQWGKNPSYPCNREKPVIPMQWGKTPSTPFREGKTRQRFFWETCRSQSQREKPVTTANYWM